VFSLGNYEWARAMWITSSIPGLGARVTMVPISRTSFFLFSLIFQLVASMYSACVRRSAHYSNAPPTSKLLTAPVSYSRCIDVGFRMVRYGFTITIAKLGAGAVSRPTSSEANGLGGGSH
jgi:hypothetical protein